MVQQKGVGEQPFRHIRNFVEWIFFPMNPPMPKMVWFGNAYPMIILRVITQRVHLKPVRFHSAFNDFSLRIVPTIMPLHAVGLKIVINVTRLAQSVERWTFNPNKRKREENDAALLLLQAEP
jgi:hypothetical protein